MNTAAQQQELIERAGALARIIAVDPNEEEINRISATLFTMAICAEDLCEALNACYQALQAINPYRSVTEIELELEFIKRQINTATAIYEQRKMRAEKNFSKSRFVTAGSAAEIKYGKEKKS